MKLFTFTQYENLRDTSSKPKRKTWKAWVEILTAEHDVRGDASDTDDKKALDKAKDGPALVFAAIPKKLSRKKVNVVDVYALGIDIDNLLDEEVEKVLKTLAPFEYVAYSTHKHSAKVVGNKPRLRIVLPLATPHPAVEHPKVWDRMQAFIGGASDKATKDASRLNFLPSTFPGGETMSSHNKTGKFVSVDDFPETVKAKVEAPPTPLDTVAATEQLLDVLRKCKDPALNRFIRKIGKGEPFSDATGRHNALKRLTWYIASRNKRLDLGSFEEIFAKSLAAMDDEMFTVEHAYTCYVGAIEKGDAFEREGAQADRQKLIDERTGNEGAYTEDELNKIRERQGFTSTQKIPWVLVRGQTYFFLTPEGYDGPRSENEVLPSAYHELKRAPVALQRITERGVVDLTGPQLVKDNGAVAKKQVASLSAQVTTFDSKTGTLYEAVCPLRDLKPQFNADLDQWLKILCGENYEKMLDWLAVFPDLDKLLCAIYFKGAKGAGKSLLAQGLSRLWSETGTSSVRCLVENFNGDLVRCPIAFADEQMPQDKGKGEATASLREHIGTTYRVLNRKYIPECGLEGAIRVILAANNDSMLRSSGVSSAEDIEAIGQRFLYIEVSDEASKFLEQLDYDKNRWINEDIIAKHALHLRETRSVVKGKRFWVEGSTTSMHKLTAMSRDINSNVIEFICNYMASPNKLEKSTEGMHRVLRERGRLYINANCIVKCWDLYMSHINKSPTLRAVTEVLKSVSEGDAQYRRIRGGRARVREIKPDIIWTFNEQHGVGDLDEMKARLYPGEGIEAENVLKFKEKTDAGEDSRDPEVDRGDAGESTKGS